MNDSKNMNRACGAAVREAGMNEETPSPCVKLCAMNARTGWCDGCLRTLDEIACWGSAGNEAKRAILERLRERQRESA